MVVLEESSGNNQTKRDSFYDDHECLYRIVWQTIQQLLKYFSLDKK